MLVVQISSKRAELHSRLNKIFIKSIPDNVVKSDHVFSLEDYNEHRARAAASSSYCSCTQLQASHPTRCQNEHQWYHQSDIKHSQKEVSAQNFRGHISTPKFCTEKWLMAASSVSARLCSFYQGSFLWLKMPPFIQAVPFVKKDFISICLLTQLNGGMIAGVLCIKSQL